MDTSEAPQNGSLRDSLLATLAYFDLFDYPLTLAELLRYRYRLPADGARSAWTAADALSALRDPDFGEKDGYFFLAGRGETVETRLRRFRESGHKLDRARRVNAFLRLLPSVRMTAVCNSLALHNADTESDIDLFVVCADGTLWTTRLLVVGALALLGMRPDAKTSADRVCMSFFVSASQLSLERFALQPDDTYLRYWIATLLPLHDADGTRQKFVNANGWAHDRLPGMHGRERTGVTTTPRWTRPLLGLLRAFDGAARAVQMRRFPAQIRAMANLDSRVAVSDDVLKFHVQDRRAEFEARFNEKLAALGVSREAPAETADTAHAPAATQLATA